MDALKRNDPRQVGRYRLIGRLGGGGMGRVFLGVSPGGRQVAVKIIHSELADDEQFRERFAREIEAVRRVGGFHTAPVVDADPEADPPWMVTAYIQGPSLQDAITERGPLSLDQVRTLGAELAEGLAAIHACNLVHRDLKPSNVILAEDGPRIIDFGIARTGEASRITMTGFVVGTYSYMSPEQVRGQVAGPASDVFSLGCTLAFAATARAPFGDDSIASVVHRITSEPPDLTGLTDKPEFRQLISECLAKSPDDRPSLDDILGRLTGAAESAPEPPLSYAEPSPEGGNGMDSGLAGEASSRQWEPTLTVPGGSVVAPDQTAAHQRPSAARTSGQIPELGSGEGTEPQAVGRRSVRHVPRRTAAIAAGAAAVVLLGAGLGIVLSSGHPKPRASGRSASAASRLSSSSPPALPEATLHDPQSTGAYGLAFSSDTTLATGDGNGNVYVWNAAGKLVTTLSEETANSVNSVAFNPVNDSFASANSIGATYVWNAANLQLTGTLQNPNGQDNDSVAFSPDGDFVAAGNQNGTTYLWDVAPDKSGEMPAATFRDPGGKSVYGVAFSADGSSLATADTDGSAYVWNVATGRLTATFHVPDSQELYDVAFSPDESLIAASSSGPDNEGAVYLWNTATGKLAATWQTPDGSDLADIAFSPNGRFLAAADTLGSVDLWNVATGDSVVSLPSPSGQPLINVAFSPDGDTIATTDTKGNTFLWNARWLDS
jgi:serine/threonine protein kinase